MAEAIAVSLDGDSVFVTGGSVGSSHGEDYATIAYNSATGAPRWLRRYSGPGDRTDHANAVTVSEDGIRVFVTGESDCAATSDDYATIAYDAFSRVPLWLNRYNGPGNDIDAATSLAASPNGSDVFVTGISVGVSNDYATVSYDQATGAEVWVSRYDGPDRSDDQAASVAVRPDGSMVFVTGSSVGAQTYFDYATVVYAA